MAITEQKVLSQVNALPDSKSFNVQWTNKVFKDGELLTSAYERKCYTADQEAEFLAEVEGAANYIISIGGWEANPDTPIKIPTISMRQARLALFSLGLLTTVDSAITNVEYRIWWDYSTTVERSHPLVDAVLTALGKTPEEIDQMFIEASKL